MSTIRLTMAQALVKFLANQYVLRDGEEHPFFAGVLGIFGHGNVTGIGQALEEIDALRYYQPRNEQSSVHIAAGYAKMKNRLQTFACTSSVGPGATNMVTGAALATINRLPVLILPGDTFANRLPHPVLQQLEHPMSHDLSVNDAFRPVSKFFDRINRPEQLLRSLPEAMRVLTDQAETGAVTLAMPEDVQTEAYDYPASFFEKRVIRIPRVLPPESEIAVALEMIRAAKRPLIIAGGGVLYSEATEALGRLASECGIPVSETQAGKGSLPWNHPWNVGAIGSNGTLAANRLAREADLVIAIGTRMSDFTTASHTAFQHPDVKFIGLNVASMDAFKLGAFPLIGDARVGIEALTNALSSLGYRTDASYHQEVCRLKEEWDQIVTDLRTVDPAKNTGAHLPQHDEEATGVYPTDLTQAQAIGLVNDASGPRDVVICAAGSMPGDLLKLWRTQDPKGYHVEYGYSCMGYEIPGGLGVKMADPSREVYVMIGDGSYLMLNTEIVTAIQEGYKLTIVLIQNYGFQSIHGLQMSSGSPSFGNELRFRDEFTGRLSGKAIPVDYAQNAASLGAKVFRADSADELRSALEQAKKETQTVLIHVRVNPDARVPGFESWWDVPIAEASSQESVKEARRRYEENRAKQRFYY